MDSSSINWTAVLVTLITTLPGALVSVVYALKAREEAKFAREAQRAIRDMFDAKRGL